MREDEVPRQEACNDVDHHDGDGRLDQAASQIEFLPGRRRYQPSLDCAARILAVAHACCRGAFMFPILVRYYNLKFQRVAASCSPLIIRMRMTRKHLSTPRI